MTRRASTTPNISLIIETSYDCRPFILRCDAHCHYIFTFIFIKYRLYLTYYKIRISFSNHVSIMAVLPFRGIVVTGFIFILFSASLDNIFTNTSSFCNDFCLFTIQKALFNNIFLLFC